jgi:uncharacterized protein YjiS (DUF1127 family)
MIGHIKNIRFTYQLESISLHRPGKTGGRSGWPRSDAAAKRASAIRFCVELEMVMPAITLLAISAALSVGRALPSVVRRASRRAKRALDALRNRRVAVGLAGLDDRMLADIGLTRSDLRDAYARPLWHDPTQVLAQRAAERRLGRKQAFTGCVSALAFAAPFGGPPPVRCYPSRRRPLRYLI